MEKTVELVKFSIKFKAKLSLNSFPTVEAYSGSPDEDLAKKYNWPVKTVTIIRADKTRIAQVTHFLPIDREMRSLFENDALLERYKEILDDITLDKEWPPETISRSIGINTLVLFMAAYGLLKIKEVTFMRELIFHLIRIFHKK
ncbi:MAG: hypothetical protein HQK92_09670 [Nitrospirae bacterium]|nr:hypothetical protein [Nitrospirota bacterium]